MRTVYFREDHMARAIRKIHVRSTGCWEWTGTIDLRSRYGKAGNGVRYINKYGYPSEVKEQSHRVFYRHFIGPIPDGLELDHLCVNRKCSNPWHLEPVTSAENARRMMERRPFCINGHDKSLPGATYKRKGMPNFRGHCKICVMEQDRAYRDRVGQQTINEYARQRRAAKKAAALQV